MQPLTAARPLKQRALHTWVAVGRRSGRREALNGLCVRRFSLSNDSAGGDQKQLSTASNTD